MKSNDYKSIIDYAKKHDIRFAVIDGFKEIDSAFEFNGLSAIDTETFETPCCFAVDRALVLCLKTPADMTPEDTGESYPIYDSIRSDLSLFHPQYIVPDGAYIKLMIWCDWAESETICDDFVEHCNEAIKSVTDNIKDPVLDFRVTNDGDPTPNIYSVSELKDMFNDYNNGVEGMPLIDCEMYINIDGSAFSTDHGVKVEMYEGLTTFVTY
jgi:hypothetical protein